MGCLQSCFKRKEHTILLVGLSDIESGPISKTYGVDMESIKIKNQYIKLYDLPGIKSLSSIWKDYYEEAHAFIFVTASANSSKEEEDLFENFMKDQNIDSNNFLSIFNKHCKKEKQQMEEKFKKFNAHSKIEGTGENFMKLSIESFEKLEDMETSEIKPMVEKNVLHLLEEVENFSKKKKTYLISKKVEVENEKPKRVIVEAWS